MKSNVQESVIDQGAERLGIREGTLAELNVFGDDGPHYH